MHWVKHSVILWESQFLPVKYRGWFSVSAAKVQLHIAEVVILATFSAAGFEIAAALFSWRQGELIPKYLILAGILLMAGLLVNELYRRAKAGGLAVARVPGSDRRR